MNTRTLSLVALCLAACVPEPPDGERAASLNGTVTIQSSCSGHESTILAAFAIMKAQVVDHPQLMIDCLANATLSGTRDAWAEEIVAKLGQDMPTTVKCDNGTYYSARATPGVSYEELTYSIPFLAGSVNAVDNVAAITLHEISHNKGYTHHDTTRDPLAGNTSEYHHTVPFHLQICSLAESANQPVLPSGTPRTAVPDRAELGPVGREGGFPSEISCAAGAFVGGLNLRAGGAVDQIGFACKLPSGAAQGNSGTAGEAGGYPASQACNFDELAVGLVGSAEVTLNSVGLICNRTANITGGITSTQRTLQQIGNPAAGYTFTRLCPTGMALQSSFARSGALVDRLRPMCQRVNFPTPQVHFDRVLPRIGGLAANEPWEEILECPGRSVVGEIDGTFSSEVFHLSSSCRVLNDVLTNTGTYKIANSDLAPKVEGAGGWEGTAATQACPAGQVAVGVNGRADDRLRRIGLLCVKADDWSRANVTPNVVPVSALGTSTAGTPFDVRCNRGEFIAGWKVRTGKWDVTRVTYIEPVCRSFPNPHFCAGPCTNPLTVFVAGPGRVTGTPAFNCDEAQTCTAQMGTGTTVVLNAIPDASGGASFVSWSGCPSPSETGCTATMTAARNITATFTAPPCTFTACKAECFQQCRAEGGTTIACNSECAAFCAECQ